MHPLYQKTSFLGCPAHFGAAATDSPTRQERERVHMPGLNHSEMTVVEGGKLGLIQTLDHRHHRCIDEADIAV